MRPDTQAVYSKSMVSSALTRWRWTVPLLALILICSYACGPMDADSESHHDIEMGSDKGFTAPQKTLRVMFIAATRGNNKCAQGFTETNAKKNVALWKLRTHLSGCSKNKINLSFAGVLSHTSKKTDSDGLWYEIENRIYSGDLAREADRFVLCYSSDFEGDGMAGWGAGQLAMLNSKYATKGSYLAHEFLHTMGLGDVAGGLMGKGSNRSCPNDESVAQGWWKNFPKAITLPNGYTTSTW